MPSADNSDEKFWAALHDVLRQAWKTLPHGDVPQSISWSHPDDQWKNDAELEAQEEEICGDCENLIRAFCANQKWPSRSKNPARFFVRRRIEWAVRFTRVLTILNPETNKAAIPRPKESGWQLLEWLLIDAYAGRNAPSSKDKMTIVPVFEFPSDISSNAPKTD
jgi:hypothetical protein